MAVAGWAQGITACIWKKGQWAEGIRELPVQHDRAWPKGFAGAAGSGEGSPIGRIPCRGCSVSTVQHGVMTLECAARDETLACGCGGVIHHASCLEREKKLLHWKPLLPRNERLPPGRRGGNVNLARVLFRRVALPSGEVPSWWIFTSVDGKHPRVGWDDRPGVAWRGRGGSDNCGGAHGMWIGMGKWAASGGKRTQENDELQVV